MKRTSKPRSKGGTYVGLLTPEIKAKMATWIQAKMPIEQLLPKTMLLCKCREITAYKYIEVVALEVGKKLAEVKEVHQI